MNDVSKPAPVTLGVRRSARISSCEHAQRRSPGRTAACRAARVYFDHGGDKPLIDIVEGTEAFRTGAHQGLTFDLKRLYFFDADGQRLC